MKNESARSVDAMIGAWLLLSAFVWTHTQPQFRNAIVVGVMAIVVAVSAAAKPPVRYLNTILGVWLFLSAWLLPRMSVATMWNHLLVGAALTAFSLVSPDALRARMMNRPL
jgi:hypothetical protein